MLESNPENLPPEFLSCRVRKGDYFFLNLKPEHNAGLTVVCGGRELCGRDYSVERESFPYWSIEYVFSGFGELNIAGREYALQAGDMFAYGPGIYHKIRTAEGKSMVKFFVDFTGERGKSLLLSGPLGKPQPIHFSDAQPIRELFMRMLQDGKSGGNRCHTIVSMFVELLIVRADAIAVSGCQKKSPALLTYHQCREYIQQYCLKVRGLQEVAVACHVSEPYICKIFRRFHSCSPYKYLLQCKMSHAASLLLGEQCLVKEAAHAIGFEDQYHFSKAFKRLYGVSPETFRQQRR